MPWPDEKDVRKAVLGYKVVNGLYALALTSLAVALGGANAYPVVAGNASVAAGILFSLAIVADFVERTKHFHEVASVKLLGAVVLFVLATYGAVRANLDIGELLGVDPSTAKVSFAALAVYHAVITTAKWLVYGALLLVFPLSLLSPFSKHVRQFREKRRLHLTEVERNIRVQAPGSGRTRRFRNIGRVIGSFFILIGVALLDPDGPNHKMLVSNFIVKADFYPNRFCDAVQLNRSVMAIKDGKVVVATRNASGMYAFSLMSCSK